MAILRTEFGDIKEIEVTGELIMVGAQLSQDRAVLEGDAFLVTETEIRAIAEDVAVKAIKESTTSVIVTITRD